MFFRIDHVLLSVNHHFLLFVCPSSTSTTLQLWLQDSINGVVVPLPAPMSELGHPVPRAEKPRMMEMNESFAIYWTTETIYIYITHYFSISIYIYIYIDV